MEGDEDDFKEVSNIDIGEQIHAKLRIRLGGKAPMAEMECKIIVKLDRLESVPTMLTDTLDKLYTQAQEKQLLGM